MTWPAESNSIGGMQRAGTLFARFMGSLFLCLLALKSEAANLNSISSPDDFAATWNAADRQPARVEELFGRIQKGKSPEDFLTMTNDADRKIIFYMGSDALEDLLVRSDYQSLIRLGYTPDYISSLLRRQHSFQLTVFNNPGELVPATWDSIAELVQKYHPSVASKVLSKLTQLKLIPFNEIEEMAISESGLPFLAVEEKGKDHPLFINERSLKERHGKLWEVRAFLYYQIRLTELFSGDGYTLTQDGARGVREFAGGNLTVASLPRKAIIPLHISPKDCIATLPKLALPTNRR